MNAWELFRAEERRRQLERRWFWRRLGYLGVLCVVGAAISAGLTWLVPWPFALVCASILAVVLTGGGGEL